MSGSDGAGYERAKSLGLRLLLIAVLLSSPSVINGCGQDQGTMPFDSRAWKARPYVEADGGDGTRYRMVRDLKDRVGLKGRTRQEVVDLLGPPDPGSNSWKLGPSGKALESHSTFLTVEFGTDGRVNRVIGP